MNKNMRIYLDNCCFNRPFDDQSQIRVRLESEAKLFIQENIKEGKIELAWSYILSLENKNNPFEERNTAISKWKNIAILNILESKGIIDKANELQGCGVKSKDALHVSCSVEAKCRYFLTTDDKLKNKLQSFEEVQVINPLEFITLWSKL